MRQNFFLEESSDILSKDIMLSGENATCSYIHHVGGLTDLRTSFSMSVSDINKMSVTD
jgi:hypothetical protein